MAFYSWSQGQEPAIPVEGHLSMDLAKSCSELENPFNSQLRVTGFQGQIGRSLDFRVERFTSGSRQAHPPKLVLQDQCTREPRKQHSPLLNFEFSIPSQSQWVSRSWSAKD